MKSITIKGSKREIVGKLSTKALRNADTVSYTHLRAHET